MNRGSWEPAKFQVAVALRYVFCYRKKIYID